MTIMQQSNRPNLDELWSLIALADTGSFTAAGRRLSLDPSLISRRLQSLERRLGVRLADRTTRRLRLTEAGNLYLERIRPLVLGIEQVEQEVASLADGDPSGHLRVSLPGSFGAAWLGPAIAAFLAAHPRISIEADTSNRVVNLIEEGFDAAIRLGALADSRLTARKIADRRRLLCASPAYLAAHGVPQLPGDLTQHACLYSSDHANPGRWSFADKTDPVTVFVQGRFVSPNADLLVDAARAGIGILYTSDWYVAADLSSGRLAEVLPNFPIADQGAVYLVTPATKGAPSKTRAFAQWMTAHLQRAPWRAA